MLLLAPLIVLAWSAALLLVAGLCAAAGRGDEELGQGVCGEPAASLQPAPAAPAVDAHERPARIAA